MQISMLIIIIMIMINLITILIIIVINIQQTYYQTLVSPVKNVALPLAQKCWNELTNQAKTDMYTNGDRPGVKDDVIYISSQRPHNSDAEKQMKADYLSNAATLGRNPQSVICIGINASTDHVRHVADLCHQDKVFIVDQSSALDKNMSKYMNDIICGDVQGKYRRR